MSLRPEEINFQDTWNNLQKIVNAIFALSNISRTVWNDGFLDIYRLCEAPESFIDKLYVETKNFLDEHVNRLFNHVSSSDRDNILQNYYEEWRRYSESITHLQKLYSYSEGLGIEIGKLGLEIWKNRMIEPLQASLVSRILEHINHDRMGNGHLLNSEVIRGVSESFVTVEGDNMKLYKSLLEEPLVTASAEYFRLQAENWFQNCSISEYMKRVISLLQEESIRCQRFLHSSSHVEIKMCGKKHMVEDYSMKLLSEAKSIISQDRKQDMANMYMLLCYIHYYLILYATEFENHILDEALHRVHEIGGDNFTSFVEAIVFIYKKYKQITEEIFESYISFTEALDYACKYIVNDLTDNQSYKSSKLLAEYCDHLLKKSSKGLSEKEVDEKLSDVTIIIKYLDKKDTFQMFYSRMLAERLVHQNSQSLDTEESMISKLKSVCDYEFFKKQSQMCTDMKISE